MTFLEVLSSRDPLHFKFTKVKKKKQRRECKCNKIKFQNEIPGYIYIFFLLPSKGWDSSCPFTPACPGFRLFVLGATFCNKLERDLQALFYGFCLDLCGGGGFL